MQDSGGMQIFVCGTDTDVGKTAVCAVIGRIYLDLGLKVRYQKWVSTGNKAFSEDAVSVYRFWGLTRFPHPGSPETPYCFPFPASPHLASSLENGHIAPDVIVRAFNAITDDDSLAIIEGVGGALVPLNRDLLLADLVKELDLPVLIVARAGVGTINHTLLTVEALKKRNIRIAGILLNETGKSSPLVARDNMEIIQRFTSVRVLGLLPFAPDLEPLLEDMRPVALELREILLRL